MRKLIILILFVITFVWCCKAQTYVIPWDSVDMIALSDTNKTIKNDGAYMFQMPEWADSFVIRAVRKQTAVTFLAKVYSTQSGISVVGDNLEGLDKGDFIQYNNLNLGGTKTKMKIVYGRGNPGNGTMEVRLGSRTGTVVGTFNVSGISGEWQVYKDSPTITLTQGLTGAVTLVFTFDGGVPLGNLNLKTFTLTN